MSRSPKHTSHLNSSPKSWPLNPRSSSNQASITQLSVVTAITRDAQAVIVLLDEYTTLVRDELKPETQLPTSITLGLGMAEYTINSLQRHIDQLAHQSPGSLVDVVRSINFAQFPTFVTLVEANPTQHKDRKDHTGRLDLPATKLKEANKKQNHILETWDTMVRQLDRVSPAKFGNRGWHLMQKDRTALLCHRPALNRPHFPLELMHVAFYEFVKKAGLCDAKLANFHEVAEALCKCLTDPLQREIERVQAILPELKKIFPHDTQFRWDTTGNSEYLCYRRTLTADSHLIIVKVKLEEGESGDAFMHLSRYYGNIVESNPRYHETGAPVFLITMSGMLCF